MNRQGKWYDTKTTKDVTHDKLFPLIRKIKENQTFRRTEFLMYARLYGNVDVLGFTPMTYARPTPVSMSAKPKFNVVASCIDTLAAKISKNRPRPFFLTDGGDWTLQTKAKKLQKFMDGQFFNAKVYEQTDKAFIDAGVFGTGIVKVFSVDSKIKVERVMPDEILVDDAESMYATPQNIYQTKAVDRDLLCNMFPKFKSQILDLPRVDEEYGFYNVTDADYVSVVEAWHLPSSKNAKDGRHTIAVQTADLISEEWTRHKFPFAKMTFKDRLAGWYGQGIAEVTMGTQVAINRILRNIDISQYLHSAPTWLVEESSTVVSAHLNNEIGNIVKYRGIPPDLKTWAAANPDVYQQIDVHIRRAYEEVGISALSAASQKPAGLDSGKAMREYNDIESERFIKLGQKWEQFHLDIADLMIDEAKEIAKTDKNFLVLVKNGQFTESIKWSEVNMDQDKYQMQTFPTSFLPRTPGARMQYVTEMQNAGYIDPDTAQELLEMPDIENYSNLKFAGRKVIREAVEKMMNDGEYIPPEPYQDLAYTIQYGQMFYNFSKLHGAPEERLELLRRYMQQANAMIDLSQPPPPPVAAPVETEMPNV